MRRVAWIFLAAILLPSFGLAWLAIHSAQDQLVVLQHQEAIIDQGITDSLALKVSGRMDGVLNEFVETTKQMLAQADAPEILAKGFDEKLRRQWPSDSIPRYAQCALGEAGAVDFDVTRPLGSITRRAS